MLAFFLSALCCGCVFAYTFDNVCDCTISVVESGPTYDVGAYYNCCGQSAYPAETTDPLGSWDGQAVTYKGFNHGGKPLIYDYQIECNLPCWIQSVTVEGTSFHNWGPSNDPVDDDLTLYTNDKSSIIGTKNVGAHNSNAFVSQTLDLSANELYATSFRLAEISSPQDWSYRSLLSMVMVSQPTADPTLFPTSTPSVPPTNTPSSAPTNTPTNDPTSQPTTKQPTAPPSNIPSFAPTNPPTTPPTVDPTFGPVATQADLDHLDTDAELEPAQQTLFSDSVRTLLIAGISLGACCAACIFCLMMARRALTLKSVVKDDHRGLEHGAVRPSGELVASRSTSILQSPKSVSASSKSVLPPETNKGVSSAKLKDKKSVRSDAADRPTDYRLDFNDASNEVKLEMAAKPEGKNRNNMMMTNGNLAMEAAETANIGPDEFVVESDEEDVVHIKITSTTKAGPVGTAHLADDEFVIDDDSSDEQEEEGGQFRGDLWRKDIYTNGHEGMKS